MHPVIWIYIAFFVSVASIIPDTLALRALVLFISVALSTYAVRRVANAQE